LWPWKPGKNFTEGWVEFRDKKKARATAEMLNGHQIGGKRRSAYYSAGAYTRPLCSST
jgi:hypothetical protein